MTGNCVCPNPQDPGMTQTSWSSVRGWFKLLLHPTYARVFQLNYLHLNCVQVPRCWHGGVSWFEGLNHDRLLQGWPVWEDVRSCTMVGTAGSSRLCNGLTARHGRAHHPSWWCLWGRVFKKEQKMWRGRNNREGVLWTDHNPPVQHCSGQQESRRGWSEGRKLSPENVGGGGKVVF